MNIGKTYQQEATSVSLCKFKLPSGRMGFHLKHWEAFHGMVDEGYDLESEDELQASMRVC